MSEGNDISEFEETIECEDGETSNIELSEVNVIPFHLIKLPSPESNHVETVLSEDVELEGLPATEVEISEADMRSYNFEGTLVRGKYSKYYRQTYRPAWENMSDFKGWLKGVKGQPTRAYCIYCQKTLHAHRLSLLKHTCTIRHQKAAQIFGNIPKTKQANNSYDKVENVADDSIINTGDEGSNEATESQDENQLEIREINLEEMGEESEDTTENNTLKDSRISTQVTDTVQGCPVPSLLVSLYKLVNGRWTYVNEGLTDTKGYCFVFVKNIDNPCGRYKLHYDVDRYFESQKQESVFPFIEVSCLLYV